MPNTVKQGISGQTIEEQGSINVLESLMVNGVNVLTEDTGVTPGELASGLAETLSEANEFAQDLVDSTTAGVGEAVPSTDPTGKPFNRYNLNGAGTYTNFLSAASTPIVLTSAQVPPTAQKAWQAYRTDPAGYWTLVETPFDLAAYVLKSELPKDWIKILQEENVIHYGNGNGVLYLDSDNKTLKVLGRTYATDTRIFTVKYNGITYSIKDAVGTILTFASGDFNLNAPATLYIPIANVTDITNVPISLIKIAATPPNTVNPDLNIILARINYGTAVDSQCIKHINDYVPTKFDYVSIINETNVVHYKNGNGVLYIDERTKTLSVLGTAYSTDTRIFTVTYNGVTYAIKNAVGGTKVFGAEFSTTGNSTLYITIADITDVTNIPLSLIKSIAASPSSVDNKLNIILAHIIFGTGVNSQVVKHISEYVAPVIQTDILRLVNELSVVRYKSGGGWLLFDSDAKGLRVLGDDVSDTRIAIIKDNNGKTYTIKGINTDFYPLPTFSAGGNATFYITIADITDATNVSPSLIKVSTAAPTTYSSATELVLGHAIFGKIDGNSLLIRDYIPAERNLKQLTGKAEQFLQQPVSSEIQVIGIGIFGDSIYANNPLTEPIVFTGQQRYEQPIRGTYRNIARDLYYALDYNRPIWRNANHAEWTVANVSKNVAVSGYGPGLDPILFMNNVAATVTAQVTATGHETFVLVFEGGCQGNAVETGTVQIGVSVNGGAFVNPSTILKGKLTKKGFGDTKIYEAALNEYDTSFVGEAGTTIASHNRFAPRLEVVYNALNPANTYTFKITRLQTEPPVRLWGCYYFTGQTVVIDNYAIPGLNWLQLKDCVYSSFSLSNTKFSIMEAPMYHDGSLSTAEVNATSVVNKLLQYNVQPCLNSCSPGGATPTGRAGAVAGDTSASAYWPAMQFYNYFNEVKQYAAALADISLAPKRGDTYQVTILGTNYTLTASVGSTIAIMRFVAPVNMPIPIFPATITKLSGASSSATSIVLTSNRQFWTMEEHRDMVKRVCDKFNIRFVDVFQAFNDLAVSVGESLATLPYDMDLDHPLYPEVYARYLDPDDFPGMTLPFQMNYMTNYFNLEDSHHLSDAGSAFVSAFLFQMLFEQSALQS